MRWDRNGDGRSAFSEGTTDITAESARLIDDQNSVLTVVSGARGTGSHVTMFLEYLKGGVAVTRMVELRQNAGDIIINWLKIQEMTATGGSNFPTPDNDPITALIHGDHFDLLAGKRHQSYRLEGAQKLHFTKAVKKFKTKVDNGRYRYVVLGGALGWVGTLPTTHGVNCSDFVIKILKDSGIANLGHRLYELPKRVSGP
jgi:hypothetical protein